MTTHYKKTIRPADVTKKDETVTINRITNTVRDRLQMIFGPLGPVGEITVEITTTEQLTDAAGSPLMTRGADDG